MALVGARRARQGLGPFVARQLWAEGVEIRAVLGTSGDSVEEALRELEPGSRPRPRGYTDLRELLARESVDALVILSPHATHAAYLESALEAGLHVLCEKPLLWGGPDLAARAAELVEGFARVGLLLCENCQWPFVLEAYRELFPESQDRCPESFGMQLAPAACTPREMLADSLSHPLSVLQTLLPVPDDRVDEILAEFTPPEALEPSEAPPPGAQPGSRPARLDVAFRYAGCIRVELRLEESRVLPRPAALALDGRWAHREVREPGYVQYLTAPGQSVKVPDPLGGRVGRFVADLHEVLSGRPPADGREIAQRMALFETIERSVSGQLEGASGR